MTMSHMLQGTNLSVAASSASLLLLILGWMRSYSQGQFSILKLKRLQTMICA